MKSTLLSSYSNFGKYLSTNFETEQNETTFTSITLKQNFIHQRPFTDCKFDIPGNRLYLLDNKGTLIHLNLNDNSFSTLKNEKVKDFTIDGNNSLSLLYVSPQSQLFRVSFENKKPKKVMNLNMSKILAFERNYLRQLILVLDYKLLFLCDLSNPSKIKSLKAGYNQTFTNACFASNNRFLILATKNIEIKILQIVNFQVIHEIRLPFAVENLKIQVSYDSRKIAIYGNCHVVFFINISEKTNFSYELIEVPFLKTIYQLKYTYQNEILFLGNDQIIYAISPAEPTKAVPIFNEDYHVRLMAFDISLDCKKMAVVSNRTVYGFKFNKGLKAAIESKETFKKVEFRENGFNQVEEEISKQEIREENGNYQYDDEDLSEEDSNSNIKNEALNVDGMEMRKALPKIKDFSEDPMNPIISELIMGEGEKSVRVQINQIFNYIISNFREITLGQTQNVALTILKIYKLMNKKADKCLNYCHFLFEKMSLEIEKLEHYSLIFCPEIVSILEKRFQLNFFLFFKENMTKLFLHYFSPPEQIKLLNWFATQFHNSEFLLLVFISTLQQIVRLVEKAEGNWEQLILPKQLFVTFSEVHDRFERLKNDSRYSTIINKKNGVDFPVPQNEVLPANYVSINEDIFQNKLQKLILRQEQIKRALTKIQHDKPDH